MTYCCWQQEHFDVRRSVRMQPRSNWEFVRSKQGFGLVNLNPSWFFILSGSYDRFCSQTDSLCALFVWSLYSSRGTALLGILCLNCIYCELHNSVSFEVNSSTPGSEIPLFAFCVLSLWSHCDKVEPMSHLQCFRPFDPKIHLCLEPILMFWAVSTPVIGVMPDIVLARDASLTI